MWQTTNMPLLHLHSAQTVICLIFKIWFESSEWRDLQSWNLYLALFLWTTHICTIIKHSPCILNNGYHTDLSLLEKVQSKGTMQISDLNNLSYSESLRSLYLYSVQGWLLGADLIQYWEELNDKSCIHCDHLSQAITRQGPKGILWSLSIPK